MIRLIAIASLFSAIDVALTLSMIRRGYGDEINPCMRWCIRYLQDWACYTVAALMTIGVGIISIILRGAGAAAYGWALLGLLVAVRAGSVIWNYALWRKT